LRSRDHRAHPPLASSIDRSPANFSDFFFQFANNLILRRNKSRADLLSQTPLRLFFEANSFNPHSHDILEAFSSARIDFNSNPSIFELHFQKRSLHQMEEVHETVSCCVPVSPAAGPGSNSFVRLQ
jgi:hypothetical protein